MKCSNCSGLVKSPLLVEVQVIECPQCEEIVGVKNVVVSSSKNTINLGSSLKKMLIAARDRFRVNKSHLLETQTSYDVNKRLAKLLRRDDFRLDMSDDLYVQIDFDNNKRLARLLNISPIGAGIEFAERDRSPVNNSERKIQVPENNSEIKIELPLPGATESLSLVGRVVWSNIPEKATIFPSTTMGLQLKDIDEETRACLWDFIVKTETETHT